MGQCIGMRRVGRVPSPRKPNSRPTPPPLPHVDIPRTPLLMRLFIGCYQSLFATLSDSHILVALGSCPLSLYRKTWDWCLPFILGMGLSSPLLCWVMNAVVATSDRIFRRARARALRTARAPKLVGTVRRHHLRARADAPLFSILWNYDLLRYIRQCKTHACRSPFSLI